MGYTLSACKTARGLNEFWKEVDEGDIILKVRTQNTKEHFVVGLVSE